MALAGPRVACGWLIPLAAVGLLAGGCAGPQPVPVAARPAGEASGFASDTAPPVPAKAEQPAAECSVGSPVGVPALAGGPGPGDRLKPGLQRPPPEHSDGATAEPKAAAAGESKPAEAKAEAPKEPTFKLRGRIEADAISVSQDPKDRALFGNFQNAVGFRRARLGSEGTAGENARWVAEVDFAGGNLALKDAFLAVNHLPVLREVRVGHVPEPFTLEGQTRSIWFPFTERSPSFTFDPARNWGVAFYSHSEGQRLFAQAGAFRSGTDNTGTDIGDGNDWAATGRVVALPWVEEGDDSLHLLHVGGAASQRNAKNNTVTFNQGPQSTLLDSGVDNPRTPFVPTVTFAAEHYQLFNLQSALVLGPLSFQAEWTGTRVEQLNGQPVVLSGWYVLASLFLTGEHRGYNREFGTFWEPVVRRPFVCPDGRAVACGPGAWELTARLACLDFDHPDLPAGPNGQPAGTRTTTVTVGLNWYLNDQARLMFNYVHAVPTYPPFGPSSADVFTVRSAVFW